MISNCVVHSITTQQTKFELFNSVISNENESNSMRTTNESRIKLQLARSLITFLSRYGNVRIMRLNAVKLSL